MKTKLSISMDSETVKEIAARLTSEKFRNKSHLIEYAVKKMLKEE